MSNFYTCHLILTVELDADPKEQIESFNAFCGYLENLVDIGTIYEAQLVELPCSDEVYTADEEIRADILNLLETCVCHECIGILDHIYASHCNQSEDIKPKESKEDSQLGHEGTSVDGTVDDATFFKDS